MCDWWHGYGHTDDCPTNPWMIEQLAHRICDINTSIAEQVRIAWLNCALSQTSEKKVSF